ncbi:hypothetical protein DJ018_17280 [Phenylobacterium deserti]|uniref:Uncharacterized protein n=1 Tax=Phenylobacterium deserti TaxID=1914756 RepID=A0A328A8V1_9CAUL|nr:hypothetical protein DJ018_17280 [Phenylobacterium deserti]
MLAEVADLCLTAAREAHARLLETPEPDAFADLASALHKLTRSVRQSVALEAKLVRDAAREARAAEAAARETAEVEREAGVERRKDLLNLAVERAIWRETDGLDAERRLDVLGDAIEQLSLCDDFLSRDAKQQIADLCHELGVWDGEGALPAHLADRADRIAADHERQKQSGLSDEDFVRSFGLWGSNLRRPSWRDSS